MRSKHGAVPGLAVVMVGERRDSAKYVSMKQVRHRRPRMSGVETDPTTLSFSTVWLV